MEGYAPVGPGPYVLGFQRLKWDDEFPFSVPAVATIERLELGQSVTVLAGDNGSGKSTILEVCYRLDHLVTTRDTRWY
jgi:predicted ATPase